MGNFLHKLKGRVHNAMKHPWIFIDLLVGASRSEPHTSELNQDFSVYVHNIYMYISAVRMSFRIIYLSSISTICKFKQFMRMHYTLCYIERSGKDRELQRHKNNGEAKLQR